MYKYKVGDILLCKKDYDIGYTKKELKFKKGNFYKIGRLNEKNQMLAIIFTKKELADFWFSLITHTSFSYVNDYFYTKQEIRKLKLEKLENV